MTWSGKKRSQLGRRVFRAAADLFDGSTTIILTVLNGRVNILGFHVEVSGGAHDNTNDTVKFVANPTTGADVDLCATLDVVDDEEGTIYSLTGTLADALVGTAAGAVADMAKGIIVNEGTIDCVSGGDSNNTNSSLQSVTVFYEPVDPSARVVTA